MDVVPATTKHAACAYKAAGALRKLRYKISSGASRESKTTGETQAGICGGLVLK